MQISTGIWSHLPLYCFQPLTTRCPMPRPRTEFQKISQSFCLGPQIQLAFFTAKRRSVSSHAMRTPTKSGVGRQRPRESRSKRVGSLRYLHAHYVSSSSDAFVWQRSATKTAEIGGFNKFQFDRPRRLASNPPHSLVRVMAVATRQNRPATRKSAILLE